MMLLLASFLLVLQQSAFCQTEPSPAVACASKPTGCTDTPPTNCPPARVQQWFPDSSVGIPAVCGACYYCQPDNQNVLSAGCPEVSCPVIPPTCNRVEPVIVMVNGRRCRGCSTCRSFNICPTINCPSFIQGCELYAQSYTYINGSLCRQCDVCSRYQGTITRPPFTPLPCPPFDIRACGISSQCLNYVDRFVNLGEGRRCQICPVCEEWRDPNTLHDFNTVNDTSSTPPCQLLTVCARLNACRTTGAVIRISASGVRCRDCDVCLDNPTTAKVVVRADSGSDSTTQPSLVTGASKTTRAGSSPSACPELMYCPPLTGCKAKAIPSFLNQEGESCDLCPYCADAKWNSTCPDLVCPISNENGDRCRRSRTEDLTYNGEQCAICKCIEFVPRAPVVCVQPTNCTDDRLCKAWRNVTDAKGCPTCRVCTEPFQCPRLTCIEACYRPVNRTKIVDGVVCPDCPACAFSGAHTASDGNSVITPILLPQCANLMVHAQCRPVPAGCSSIVYDQLRVGGVVCSGCPRCSTETPSTCPIFECPSIICGDSEDVYAGKRYREDVVYNVNGTTCSGCPICLVCPDAICPDYSLDCKRYTRRTDSRGCVICPFCEIWDNSIGPPLYGRSGFVQSVATAMCLTGQLYNSSASELHVQQCKYDLDLSNVSQVFTFQPNGFIMDMDRQLCMTVSLLGLPILNSCDESNQQMIWQLEKQIRFPQFFRVIHRLTGKCLDALGESLRFFGLPMRLFPCQELTRDNGALSDQWWKFEEYA